MNQEINSKRLFLGSCFALIATSVAFAMVGAIMGPIKEVFILTNEQVGLIGGAALWGFPITIVIFGPLCDTLGMRFLMRLAFLCQFAGVLLMILANGFWMLFFGALIIAMGNGLVEAACNPLVATIYPDRKTEMLNKFHVWFPGGIVIGGLIAFGLDEVGITSWQLKLIVIIIPTIIYGFIFAGQKFPATEGRQSGLSFGMMFKSTIFRPMFLILCFCMMLTASLELGPNRWIPAVLTSAGMPGILVLVWISILMAIFRYFAGPIVRKFSPIGILFGSSILGGLGLFWLSFANNFGMAILSSTLFAIGVCYFWPTMLGVTSERVPKGGAMALAWIGAVGNLAVGLLASPIMGTVADNYTHKHLPVQETVVVLEQAVDELTTKNEENGESALAAVRSVLNYNAEHGSLPTIETSNALRSILKVLPESSVSADAVKILRPAENYGGKISFRYLASLSIILMLILGGMYFRDQRMGGYQVEKISLK